jgi:hypothetical protein
MVSSTGNDEDPTSVSPQFWKAEVPMDLAVSAVTLVRLVHPQNDMAGICELSGTETEVSEVHP